MYKPLAKYYDVLQSNIEYETWINFVKDNIQKEDKIIEIGCGTATLAKKLTDLNYNVLPTDYSEAMIKEARKKKPNAMVMDITNTNINDRFDAVICCMDVINYLTTEEKLITAFTNIDQLLKDNGVLIFDIQHQTNIEYFDEYHEEIPLVDTTLIWDSCYVGDNLVKHELNFGDFGLEVHYQKFMLPQYYLKLLEPYFKNVEVFQDDYRVYFVCRKV